jgi:hypothetical protein
MRKRFMRCVFELNFLLSKEHESNNLKQDLLKDLKDGKTVYAPATKKRKRSSELEKSRKKSKSSKKGKNNRDVDSDDDGFINDDEDDDFINDKSDNENGDNEDGSDASAESESEERTPLTEDDIKKVLDEMKATKKNARRERTDIDHQISGKKAQIATLEKARKEVEVRVNSVCIQARNEYSTTAIQQDFADGVRELDMENAEEEDEENFDPNKGIRDYAEVAKSLKVFCVSEYPLIFIIASTE